MSARDSSNTHEVIGTLFQAMNTPGTKTGQPPADSTDFPYVNGGLSSGSMAVPKISKIARS